MANGNLRVKCLFWQDSLCGANVLDGHGETPGVIDKDNHGSDEQNRFAIFFHIDILCLEREVWYCL